jgi:hypothetical protein
VIQQKPGSGLVARTVELTHTPDLLSLFPADGAAWIRRGQGMIGMGEVARLEGADFTAAENWWQEWYAELTIETELTITPPAARSPWARSPSTPPTPGRHRYWWCRRSSSVPEVDAPG